MVKKVGRKAVAAMHAWRGAALERTGTTTRISYQRAVWPQNVEAGGSRKLPGAMQLDEPVKTIEGLG